MPIQIKKILIIFTIITVVFSLPKLAFAEEKALCHSNIDFIRKNIFDMSQALEKGQLDKILEYSYPALIRMAGGEKEYSNLLEKTFELMKKEKNNFKYQIRYGTCE